MNTGTKRQFNSRSLGTLTVIEKLPSLYNTVYLVEDLSGRRFVYRVYGTKKKNVDRLNTELKFLGLGIRAKRRTMAERIELSESLGNLGVNHPRILEHNSKFAVTDFIDGVLLHKVSEEAVFKKVVDYALEKTFELHSKGIVLGDRWFGSQIVSFEKLYFIHLDMVYIGEGSKELEIAELLNALTYKRSFEDVVYIAEKFIDLKAKYNCYNIAKVIDVLNKHVDYWADPKNVLSSLIRVLSSKAGGM